MSHSTADRHDSASPPALIGLDWGTSSLRACLFDGRGVVVERHSRPWGIQHLPEGGYAAAFRGIAADWLDRWPGVPVLAAGMVGSRTGWQEVPYVACPADTATIAAGIVRFMSDCGLVHLVPGVMQEDPFPDVMRGEEAQIIGAIALDPSLAAGSLIVLPGTHCKWARVENGRVTRFTTYLTGELFAVLRDHSVLGRPSRDAGDGTEASRVAAFHRGVETIRESGAAGVAGKLFTARSLVLCGGLDAADSLDYLSGLLIGEELRSALTAHGEPAPAYVLVGDPALCSRYRTACTAFGLTGVRVLDDTGPLGLWHIAHAARLVHETPAAPSGQHPA
jgi:2-dehydro-3-deoxygalactonokinase